MKKNNLFLLLIIFAVLSFLLWAFGPYISAYFLKPFSLMIWILLRFFVLSIDQKVLWGILIVVVFVLSMFRLNWKVYTADIKEIEDQNIILKHISSWRRHFMVKPKNKETVKMIKSELVQILISIYSSRKHILANYKITEAFKNREIPIPENIYKFLFMEETEIFLKNAEKWLKRILGKEAIEYYKDLKECLDFLENYMEIKDEYQSTKNNN